MVLHFAASGGLMPSKYRISVNLSEEEHAKLLAISSKYHVSMAWLGRAAINEFLKSYVNTPSQLPLGLGTSDEADDE